MYQLERVEYSNEFLDSCQQLSVRDILQNVRNDNVNIWQVNRFGRNCLHELFLGYLRCQKRKIPEELFINRKSSNSTIVLEFLPIIMKKAEQSDSSRCIL